MSNGKKQRIKQVYAAYLDMLYEVEYYKIVHSNLQKNSRHYEFIIALGGALSGGSGLGILASHWMAVPCSIITTASFILTIAKQTYDWPGRSKFAVEMIDKSGKLGGKLKSLVEDIWAKADWTDDYEKIFDAIRTEINSLPQDSSPTLKKPVTECIYDDIVARENPSSWWKGPTNAHKLPA